MRKVGIAAEDTGGTVAGADCSQRTVPAADIEDGPALQRPYQPEDDAMFQRLGDLAERGDAPSGIDVGAELAGP